VVVDPNNWVLNKVGSITTGLNGPVNVSHEVILSPNPSPGAFQVKYPANSFTSIQVFDATGKLLLERKVNLTSNLTFINAGLLPGTYFVRLNGEEKIAVKKLVIVQ
jgi:hypothetical protein